MHARAVSAGPRRRGRSAVAVALGAAVLLGSVVTGTAAFARRPAADADFPVYMHDGAHSAYVADATEIAPTTPLTKAWTFTEPKLAGAPSRGFVASPVVVGHVIFIGSNTGQFYAIDELTGSVIWQDSLGFEAKFECGFARGFAATAATGIDPTSGTPMVYAASADGNVYALRQSDGSILWKRAVEVPSPGMNDKMDWASPEIANGKIYIGLSSYCDNPLIRGGLVALDQATGKKVASFFTVPKNQVGGSVWSSPAIAPDGSVLIDSGNATGGTLIGTAQSIIRLDGNTLKRIDSYQLVTNKGDSDFGAPPTIFSATLDGTPTDMVGACNKNGIYYAWKLDDLHDGPVWKTTIGFSGRRGGGEVCLAGAIWDGANLYIGGTPTNIADVDYRGSIRKLDPATGSPVWETGLPAAVMTSATMDGAGAIIVSSYDSDPTVTNQSFLVDAATGSYTTVDAGNTRAAASGVFADDSLLIATGTGRIYAYQPAGT